MTERAEHTKPTAETRQADRADAQAEHGAFEELTPEDEQAVEGRTPSPGVAEHYEEMTERGANQQGEGRITE
ncbi:MAG: hypothetical protein QOK43_2009 [Acidimicrobiaceae bacterium]|jgi:hypothetical protein|nr:hypothetical protein [Acidimicrobiaceae bacterium]MDQ1444094.1 hypothetical protein [Acidimicrobiaceae bacterium]